jgi:hypothetical protein
LEEAADDPGGVTVACVHLLGEAQSIAQMATRPAKGSAGWIDGGERGVNDGGQRSGDLLCFVRRHVQNLRALIPSRHVVFAALAGYAAFLIEGSMIANQPP